MSTISFNSLCSFALLGLLALVPKSTARLVVFGDSLADDGNGASGVVSAALDTATMTVGTFPPPPYYKGRPTNGPIWADIVAVELGIDLESYAVVSATAGTVSGAFPVDPPFAYLNKTTSIAVPSFTDQVQQIISKYAGKLGDSHIHAVWVGANDYFNSFFATGAPVPVPSVIATISAGIERLYKAGGRLFLLLELPPTDNLPDLSTASLGDLSGPVKALSRALVKEHNKQLGTLVKAFNDAHPDGKALKISLQKFFQGIQDDPAAYGLTSVDTACYGSGPSLSYDGSICAKPDTYFYWDQRHPTRVIHKLLGDRIVREIKTSLPYPA